MDWPFKKKQASDEQKSISGVPREAVATQAASIVPAPDCIITPSASPPLPAPSALDQEWPAVFITYRRANMLMVEHVHQKYCEAYKPSSIFLDRADIEPGAHFPDQLRQAAASAVVVLVFIGRDRVSTQNERTFSRCLDGAGRQSLAPRLLIRPRRSPNCGLS